MPLEKHMSRIIQTALKDGGLDPVRVENRLGKGTPDVNFVGGWIENKAIDGWPKREGTIVKLPHYTQEQRLWQRRRVLAGGAVWVMLKVGQREWLLFRAEDAIEVLGLTNRQRLIDCCTKHWPNGLHQEELCELLRTE